MTTATPAPLAAPYPSAAAPGPAPTRSPVPTPILKPGETITWIRVDRLRFPLGEIIFTSVTFAGLAFLAAIAVGIFIGYLKGRQREHRPPGLGLR